MNNKSLKKQEILFLSRTLGRAGVGVSLVSILNNIDYSKFNVTLGIQYPNKELENELPSAVKVVYYGEITSKLYKKIYDFNKRLGDRKKNPFLRFFWHLLNKLEDLRMIYKVKKCFKNKYDTANGYHQGDASKYVIKYIKAKRKILWYHSSVIEYAWYKNIFKKADYIVPVAEKCKALMIDAWGQEVANKIVVIPCLISFDAIYNKAKAKIDFKNDKKFMILSCGRFTSEKGMDLAIQACKYLKEQTNDVTWLILGDGPLMGEMKELIKKSDVEDNMKLYGFCENPYPFFNICDMYVSPSKLESFGLTIREAMLFNKPVVSTKTFGGVNAIIDGQTGLLAEIDAKSIADSILKLMNDERMFNTIKENLKKIDFLAEQEKKIKTINELEYVNEN